MTTHHDLTQRNLLLQWSSSPDQEFFTAWWPTIRIVITIDKPTITLTNKPTITLTNKPTITLDARYLFAILVNLRYKILIIIIIIIIETLLLL